MGCALCAILFCAQAAHAAGIAIVKATGTVETRADATGGWKKVAAGQALAPGATVRTGADSTCIVQWPGGHALRMQPLSTLTITKGSPAENRAKLTTGKITAHVEKLSSGQRFEIETPTAIAGVRGTTFLVDVAPSGESLICVGSGQVVVDAGDASLSLDGGVMVAVDSQGTLSEPEPLTETLREEILEHVEEITETVEAVETGTGADGEESAQAQDTAAEAAQSALENIDGLLDEQVVNHTVDSIGQEQSGSVHFDIYITQ